MTDAESDRWAAVLSQFDEPVCLAQNPIAGDDPDRPKDGYYRLLWHSSTVTEQVVLYQLAVDGWVNYKNTPAIQHLSLRRLVDRCPSFQIADPGFRRYILTQNHVRAWKREEGDKPWDGLKIVIMLVMFSIISVLLLFAQQQTLAVVTGAASVVKILSDLRGRDRGATRMEA
jgi:hypothetical protein